MKKSNLVGQHFGKLEVLEYVGTNRGSSMWKCRCECGNETIVPTNNLTSGNTKSCGKCVRKNKYEDLTGQTFGYWKVLGLHEDKGYTRMWMCHCTACDKVDRPVSAKNLKSGASQSCGCTHSNKDIIKKNVEDRLIGQKFNHLTVLEYAGNGKWKCECDCKETDKNIVYTTSEKLKRGGIKSCGCIVKEPHHNSAFKDLTGQKFGHLTVIKEVPREAGEDNKYLCRCDCKDKTEVVVFAYNLVAGFTTSCGCLDISHKGSTAENEIKDYVKSLGISVEKGKRILNGKEIDILSKEHNIGIEYNGSFSHASLLPKMYLGYFDEKEYTYHRDKFLCAKEKGIHLINIFDVDWNNNQEKIKMYLRSLFLPQESIMARKCEVKKVSNDIACEFVEKYHLQGANKATMKINYGLYYEGELYAVMSFGKLRLKNTEEGQYELHRYCVKDGYTIVGGAKKLLSAFEKEYTPKYVLSYSDNDYFTGNIYKLLGFYEKGQTNPRYYWNLSGKEIKREQCQIKYLKEKYPNLIEEAYKENASNKEDYVMLSLGACKVYRSGNTKWEKFYN